jgi:hypothetical protein
MKQGIIGVHKKIIVNALLKANKTHAFQRIRV